MRVSLGSGLKGTLLGTALMGALWAVCSLNPQAVGYAAPTVAASAAAASDVARLHLQEKLDALNAFSAHFKQEVTDQSGQVMAQSEGMLYLQRPDRFMMHTTSPDELALYTQDGDIYYFDAAVNQVSIFTIDRSFSNPLLLLTSSDDKLWQSYQISESDNRFTLVPHTAKDLRSITISFVDPKGGKQSVSMLESLTMRMDDGNTNFYIFSQQQASAKESDFEFALPDDVEVDDAR